MISDKEVREEEMGKIVQNKTIIIITFHYYD